MAPSTLVIYLYFRLSFVTLGRALIMEPSTLDLYGSGSVRSLVPFRFRGSEHRPAILFLW